jgi:hypothetical protein
MESRKPKTKAERDMGYNYEKDEKDRKSRKETKNAPFSSFPKVLPVKDPPHLHFKPLHPNLPKPPTLLLMVSPVKTGKSTIISNLLLNDAFYGQEYFDEVNIISNTIANDNTSRFLEKAFNTYDFYDDRIIEDIVSRQKGFEKEEQPSMGLILDDCLGSIRREGKVNHLASRFRHYNIQLFLISSQNFRAVSPIIRQNATAVIVGSPFPNQKELGKMADEYGDLFGGANNWLKIYKLATPNRYDFLFMDLAENPPIAYSNFEKQVAIGDKILGDVSGISLDVENGDTDADDILADENKYS